ncbi:MAG: DMT family transporter [Candidatus Thorarchaeota archaeon]|jgi:drug/metabolite transporter (DMT)-like permease
MMNPTGRAKEEDEMSRYTYAWLAVLTITVLWASSLILAKIVFVELTPITFVALRYTLACPILIPMAYFTRRRQEPQENPRKHWKLLVVAGLAGPFLSQVMQYIGLNMTTASDAVLLLNFTPVFTVILAAAMIDERITVAKLLGLITATFGAIMIVINPAPVDPVISSTRLLGDVILIASTFLFAVNGIVGKIAVKSVSSVSVTLYSTLAAVPFLWMSVAIFEDLSVLFTLSLQAWIIVMWVGIVNTALAFILYYESMKYIEASKVQIALNLIGVWGVLLSIPILGEIISPLQILGGAITVIGVIMVQRDRAR